MYQIDNSTAVTTLPAPAAPGPNVGGFFSAGTPGSNDGTIVDADWLNAVQMEIINAAASVGIAPNKAAQTNLRAAMAMTSAPIGTYSNLLINVPAASSAATATADEIVVGAVLGGVSIKLGAFNQIINLTGVGVNGMDTGAPPNNGYVALYAIYNPSTGAEGLLATNATGAVVPAIYGAAHMPAGYTFSGLLSVWPTNGTGKFLLGYQWQRALLLNSVTVLSTPTPGAITSINMATANAGNPAMPPNAVAAFGEMAASSTASSTMTITVAGIASGLDAKGLNVTAQNGSTVPYRAVTARGTYAGGGQQLYYTSANSAGTPTYTVTITGYEI